MRRLSALPIFCLAFALLLLNLMDSTEAGAKRKKPQSRDKVEELEAKKQEKKPEEEKKDSKEEEGEGKGKQLPVGGDGRAFREQQQPQQHAHRQHRRSVHEEGQKAEADEGQDEVLKRLVDQAMEKQLGPTGIGPKGNEHPLLLPQPRLEVLAKALSEARREGGH